MGTVSYVLVGSPEAVAQTWNASCHGAVRVLSRQKALELTKGHVIHLDLEDQGIFVKSEERNSLREEAP